MRTKRTLFAKYQDVALKWSFNFFERMFNEDVRYYTTKRFLPIVDMYTMVINGAVLDAACGFRNPYIEKSHLKDCITVGLDIDPAVKEKNKIHKNFIITDLHTFESKQKFDIVICRYTLEHLHTPQQVLENFYNTLSNKGILIIIAPQRLHYVSITARIFSNSMTNISWRILKGKGPMPYPVYYNLCSKTALLSEANRIGFKVRHFSTIESPPTWFAAIPPLFITMCFWMAILNKFNVFDRFRSSFIAVLEKE